MEWHKWGIVLSDPRRRGKSKWGIVFLGKPIKKYRVKGPGRSSIDSEKPEINDVKVRRIWEAAKHD